MQSTSGVLSRVDHNTRPEPVQHKRPASELGRLELVFQLSLPLRGTTDRSQQEQQTKGRERQGQGRVVWRQKMVKEATIEKGSVGMGV